MDLVRLIIFLKSPIGIFLVSALIIGMCLPQDWLEGFGMLVGLGLIIVVIGSLVSLFRNL